MAESKGPASSTGYFCSLCDIHFPFKSKYMRHLHSEGHQWNVNMARGTASISEDEDPSHDDTGSEDVILSNSTECEVENESDEDNDWPPLDEFTEMDHSIIDDFMEGDPETFPCTGSDFRPFGSRTEALLFMLINSPQPIGETTLKFIFHIIRLSQPTLPSLDVLKRYSLPGFIPPNKYKTANDTDFYCILPTDVLKQCFGNPITASNIVRYPEVTSDCITEMHHADYWHSNFPAPMIAIDECNVTGHVFVNDFIMFKNTKLGFVTIGKVLTICCIEGDVKLKVQTLLSCDQTTVVYRSINVLYPDEDTFTLDEIVQVCLQDVVKVSCPIPRKIQKMSNRNFIGLDYQEYCNFVKHHPLKLSAGGLPVYICPLVLFSDDTSGNRSKKWNKFDYWCLTLAGLPVHNRLSSLDIVQPLVDDFKKLEEGVILYDASVKQRVIVIAPIMAILADNARASELVNHLGSRAKKFCRKCMATSDDTEIGVPRTKSIAIEQIRKLTEAATEQERKSKRTEFGMKECNNPLFNLSVDLFRCTPVETLHTILLGACKYMLRTLMGSLSTTQKKEVLARINSWSYCGFSERITGNIVYHYKSFVGRDFKAWLQMVLFIIPSLVTDQEISCWFALVKLFRCLYCMDLRESLITTIQELAVSFIGLITRYSPQYSKRLKIHILLHLAHDLRQFGPQSLINTERFESFNSLMRNQNVYSNRHSPSKDICHSFAVMEHLRFICSGGTFTGSETMVGNDLKKLYESAQVQKFINFKNSKELNSSKAMYQPGALRKLKHKTTVTKLRDVLCCVCLQKEPVALQVMLSERHCTLVDVNNELSEETLVLEHGALVSSRKELINIGSFVQLENKMIGILLAILQVQHNDLSMSVCLVQKFDEVCGPEGEPQLSKFECPLLKLSTKISSVSAFQVSKSVSVAHQCKSSCVMVGSEFKHDYSNTNFCFNIFCIGN